MPGFAPAGPPEVTTPRTRRHRTVDARVHRSRDLHDDQLTVVDGIVTTSTARTVLDLAGILAPPRVERVVDNALAMQMLTVDALAELVAQIGTKGRAGTAVLRRLLGERGDDRYVPPASELEARFLALVRRSGLAEPVRQLPAGDAHSWVGRVDFAYPGLRLLIELDSRRHHTAKLDHEADRIRDNRLVAAGWRVLRITWQQLIERPSEVVALLRCSGVTQRGSHPAPRPQLAAG